MGEGNSLSIGVTLRCRPDASFREGGSLTLRRAARFWTTRAWSMPLTPLCPAGHLPLKGGDRHAVRFRPSRFQRMTWL
ncbi:hypothetical protein YA62_002125 [Agrobacterium sp. LC34]|nr:hypothetical protein CFBP6623_02640 [Agrobacterium tumefaciens]TKT67617.1 hypothetical protein YA62_002125 [Agrobacterium sp. LC34]